MSTTRRRPPQCHACWNPQLGNIRPLHHLYCGDCKLTPPSTTAAATASATAAAAAAAAAVAAFITANAAPTTAAAANTSAASNAAAAVFQARTEAALATRLPDSTGSLFESMRSGTDEGQWARVQEEPLSTACLSGRINPFDRHRQRREEVNQLTVGLSVDVNSLDRQHRIGDSSSTAQLLQLPPPL